MNAEFYQHDAKEMIEEQEYFKRDSTGYVGKSKYPWSAKLNTIEMGKIAVDIFEWKKLQREYWAE